MDNSEHRIIEDIISDMQHCAEKYLKSQKSIHEKMLEISVSEGLEFLEALKSQIDEIDDEELKKTYALNLLVPIQLLELIKSRKKQES